MNITPSNNFPTNLKNNLTFSKKYLDTGVKVRNVNGTRSNCNFVEYERNNFTDIIQIENLEKIWHCKAPFINAITSSFKTSSDTYYASGSHLYALEDERGDTLAIAKVLESKNINTGVNNTYISYIQAAPDEIYQSKTKHYKGLGETLVSSITQKAKDSGADFITVTSVNDSFWDSSKLFKSETSKKYSDEKILRRENFDDYISYVNSKLNSGKISMWG